MEAKSEESYAFKLGALTVINTVRELIADGKKIIDIEKEISHIESHVIGGLQKSLYGEVETNVE